MNGEYIPIGNIKNKYIIRDIKVNIDLLQIKLKILIKRRKLFFK